MFLAHLPFQFLELALWRLFREPGADRVRLEARLERFRRRDDNVRLRFGRIHTIQGSQAGVERF